MRIDDDTSQEVIEALQYAQSLPHSQTLSYLSDHMEKFTTTLYLTKPRAEQLRAAMRQQNMTLEGYLLGALITRIKGDIE